MAEAVIRRPLTVEARVRTQVSPCAICGEQSALGQVCLKLLPSSPVSIIPLTLHAHLHLHVALIRRTNGWSLGTFQQCRRDGGWGEAGTNYRGPAAGRGPDYVAYVLVVSLFVDCTNSPFQIKLRSLCNWRSFRFSVKIFCRSTLAGGGKKFPPGPEPAVSDPAFQKAVLFRKSGSIG
jgi:hypothetical protein